ncbi:MAG: hypothetical protein FWC44_00670 [Methanomassiliicoccaceae archaeon]|nr:hypothetical protein [Methanomassiliicoccaceae archaeon]
MKTLNTAPRVIKIGCGLGFLGGLISIICMVFFFDSDKSMLLTMGMYLLIAVMFFSLGGGLTKEGHWTWNTLLLMTFLTIAAVGCSVVFEVMELYVGILLVAIGALIVVSLMVPSSKTWANMLRA